MKYFSYHIKQTLRFSSPSCDIKASGRLGNRGTGLLFPGPKLFRLSLCLLSGNGIVNEALNINNC